jgi:thiol-disulfide isomerase/thioredoxin
MLREVGLMSMKGNSSMTGTLGRRLLVGSLSLLLAVPAARAAAPTAEQALKLMPVQKDVEIDTPPAADIPRASIKGEKMGSFSAWVVRDAAGQMLRKFADTNNDNVVDQWCYFRDGIEVYRDIDSNFNGKADQYRWLNTAGTRWGLDENEDAKIDSWKAISAEEASAEVVRALAEQDAARFSRLLLTESELKGLGLGAEQAKDLSEKVTKAGKQFAEAARQQKIVGPKTTWIHFGGTRPGLVPAGTEGSTKDLVVYENVMAMTDTAGKHSQVQVGTLVRVGDVWRVIDLPRATADDKTEVANAGYFIPTSGSKTAPAAVAAAESINAKTQQLLAELETIDKQLAQGSATAAQAKLNSQRADLVEKIAEASTPEDRGQWLRQMADSISASAQSGSYPEGVQRLQTLYTRVAAEPDSGDLAAYVKFRYLTAEYGLSIQDEKADFAKIQTKWLESLKQYVIDYPKSPDSAEAMMQLGIAHEFAGEEDDAKKWYARIKDEFPTANAAKKASGAITRLESVGQVIRLSGKTTSNETLDLANYRGKIVLLHYWATWCQPCVNDLATIQQLYTKYASPAGFAPVGVCLDSDVKALGAFLQKNRLAWKQLHEPQALDGRLANELGILTLPTMLLIDKDGRVLNRSITIGELENELKKRAGGGSTANTARRPEK